MLTYAFYTICHQRSGTCLLKCIAEPLGNVSDVNHAENRRKTDSFSVSTQNGYFVHPKVTNFPPISGRTSAKSSVKVATSIAK